MANDCRSEPRKSKQLSADTTWGGGVQLKQEEPESSWCSVSVHVRVSNPAHHPSVHTGQQSVVAADLLLHHPETEDR